MAVMNVGGSLRLPARLWQSQASPLWERAGFPCHLTAAGSQPGARLKWARLMMPAHLLLGCPYSWEADLQGKGQQGVADGDDGEIPDFPASPCAVQ